MVEQFLEGGVEGVSHIILAKLQAMYIFQFFISTEFDQYFQLSNYIDYALTSHILSSTKKGKLTFLILHC